MSLNLGVVMDPIGGISYKKDSTLAMLWAAAKRGHTLWYMEQHDLFLRDGVVYARMAPLQVFEDPARWYELGEATERPLAELDVILMRKDPPFDMNFIYTTYLLERAEEAGVLVVNRPAALRDCNEKLFAAQFPQCMVPTLVTADAKRLRAFVHEQNNVIVKPLDGMGGLGIFHLMAHGPNIGATLETLTHHGTVPIMAQRYIPEIRHHGDKRILLIDGEAVPYGLARIPAEGETRGNLAVGGTGRPQPLSDRDRWIAEQIGPELKRRGLIFVGLDVIGDYLTEINVTSPTCIREIDKEYHWGIADKLIAAIEGQHALRGASRR